MPTLSNAVIIGYFSLPSPSLAEHNTTAYNLAMAAAPAGAGTCSHCGTPIRHHVIIRDVDGQTRVIGTTCAESIGLNANQIHYRMTDQQVAEQATRRAKANTEATLAAEREAARITRRLEFVGDIVTLLRATGDSFYASLADQLTVGPLTTRQARYAVKATSETGRRNKRNADAWDDVEYRCCMTDDEFYLEPK